MNLESCEEGDWIYLAQFRNKRRGLVCVRQQTESGVHDDGLSD